MNKSFCMHTSVRKMGRDVIACLVAISLFASCQSYKKVPYLQDAESVEWTSQKKTLYDAKIMPKDLLTIVVSCTSPELAIPFNLTVASPISISVKSQITTQPSLQQYLVDNDGKVNFPVLGELKVGGLTKRQAEQMIVEKLEPYIKETPIVTVRMVNYKISVIGEVNHPGIYTVNNEQVNLLEAIAMAGDLTIYGKRNNVRIIRKENNRQRLITVNLNDVNVIHSSDFYLHQNDIVYVEPNKAKTQGANIGSSTNLLISITSILISMAGLIVTILR